MLHLHPLFHGGLTVIPLHLPPLQRFNCASLLHGGLTVLHLHDPPPQRFNCAPLIPTSSTEV